MGLVGGEVERIDQADPGEGEARLAGEIGDVLDPAEGAGVAVGRVEEGRDIGRRDRPEGGAAAGGGLLVVLEAGR